MEHQNIVFTNDLDTALNNILDAVQYNKLFVITDSNTQKCVLPRLKTNKHIANAVNVNIEAGDVNKNIDSLVSVWKQIGENGGTRKSVVVNLGGGVITDLGGFAASTFKRGIRFVNVPTTLLSAVDAAVGGKTGINFGGLKNEIGVFNEATDVVISTAFFDTLPQDELKSGFAEMLKHGLLKGENEYNSLIDYDFAKNDLTELLQLLEDSVNVKAEIVRIDPHEKGLRRALNLGHTVGHAFESLAMARKSPIPHGYAVAWGLVVEIILSRLLCEFESEKMYNLAKFVYENYGSFKITCDDYAELLQYMSHDKKSQQGEINCTLLSAPGEIKIDQIISQDDMQIALDIYRDLLHC